MDVIILPKAESLQPVQVMGLGVLPAIVKVKRALFVRWKYQLVQLATVIPVEKEPVKSAPKSLMVPEIQAMEKYL